MLLPLALSSSYSAVRPSSPKDLLRRPVLPSPQPMFCNWPVLTFPSAASLINQVSLPSRPFTAPGLFLTSPHYPDPLTDPVRWSLTISRVAGIRPHLSICSVILPTHLESPKSLIRRTLSNSESPARSSYTSINILASCSPWFGVIWGTWTLEITLLHHQTSPT